MKGNKKTVYLLIYSVSDVKVFFGKIFELSINTIKELSQINTLIPLRVFAPDCPFLKQGKVKNVKRRRKPMQILIETESRISDLRDCLAIQGWKEISNLG